MTTKIPFRVTGLRFTPTGAVVCVCANETIVLFLFSFLLRRRAGAAIEQARQLSLCVFFLSVLARNPSAQVHPALPSAVLVSMSNIQAGRKFAEINHEKLDKLKAEIDPLKERAKLAEEQNKLLDEQLAEAEGERSELKTRMTAMLRESQGLEEAGRRLESFVERLEAEKSGMRDQLAAMASSLSQRSKHIRLQDERGKIAIELAVAQAEKEGAVSLSSADRDGSC